MQKIIQDKEEKIKRENLDLTFKPEINEYSRKLVKSKNKKEKIEDKLIKIGNIYNNKRNKSTEEENKKSTYQPIINTNTEQYGNIKRKKRDVVLSNQNNMKKLKYNKILNNYNYKSKKQKEIKKDKNFINNSTMNHNSKTINKNSNIELSRNKKICDYLYLESNLLKQKRKKEIKQSMVLNYLYKPKISKSFDNNINNRETNVFMRLTRQMNFINKDRNILKMNRNYNDKKPSELNKNLKIKKYHKKYLSEDNSIHYIKFLDENKLNKIDKHNFKTINQKDYIKKSNNIIFKMKNIKYKELFKYLRIINNLKFNFQ